MGHFPGTQKCPLTYLQCGAAPSLHGRRGAGRRAPKSRQSQCAWTGVGADPRGHRGCERRRLPQGCTQDSHHSNTLPRTFLLFLHPLPRFFCEADRERNKFYRLDGAGRCFSAGAPGVSRFDVGNDTKPAIQSPCLLGRKPRPTSLSTPRLWAFHGAGPLRRDPLRSAAIGLHTRSAPGEPEPSLL